MAGRIYRSAIWLGGSALLLAAMIDLASVLARNLASSIHGAIELIQVALLIAGSLGLVVAIASRTHARVHMLTDRLSDAGKTVMGRATALAVATFFLCLLAGSGWIALDLWNSQEYSEVVGVPWRWLRAFANACFFAAVLILLRQMWKPRP